MLCMAIAVSEGYAVSNGKDTCALIHANYFSTYFSQDNA